MKVCNTCGTMNDDMNVSCTTCGSALPMAQPQMGYGQPSMGGQPQMGYSQPMAPAKKGNKTVIIIVIVAIILVASIIAAVLAPTIINKKNEKEVRNLIEKSVDAINDSDSEYLTSITPDFMDVGEEDYDEVFAFFEMMGYEMELVSIDEIKKMDSDDIDDLVDEIDDYYDEKVDIEKAYTAEVTAEISYSYGEESDSEESTEDFICIMIDGDWYVYQGIW